MGIMPDSSPYGSQTVTGPGWPNVEEEALAAAAASYEALAAKLNPEVRARVRVESSNDPAAPAGSK